MTVLDDDATLATVAARVLGLVDLTSLNDGDDDAAIASLCAAAVTPAGPVAAVCIYPRFVAQAREALSGSGVRVATVANFPAGEADVEATAREVESALAAGADEVDVVMPWRRFRDGDRALAGELVRACREASEGAVLKVILETGGLASDELVRAASLAAIAAGADFVKTSTGKLSPGATPAAAEAMLEAIAASGRPVGLKVSGGVRTAADAATYVELADRILGPAAVAPERLRFGASALLDDLVARLKSRVRTAEAPT